jgi:hypothetical protein
MLSDELLKLGPKIGNLSSYIVLKSTKPFRGVALDDLVSPNHRSAPRIEPIIRPATPAE